MEDKIGMKRFTPKKILLVVVTAILIGAIAGTVMFGVNTGLAVIFASDSSDIDIPYTDTVSDLLSSEGEETEGEILATDVSAIVEEAMPSIVALTTTTLVSSNDWYSYYYGEQETTGAGSGVIIAKNETELLIITSNHVVEDTDSVNVCFVDGVSVSAVIKASNSSEDLAIVSVQLSDISEETLNSIKIATMATESVSVGEGVIAIGNALGYGQSVTTGVVSALEREVTVDDMTLTLLQTDAAINPGNSGGALLNMQGELIGINEAKYSSSGVEGMGFAIPISEKTDLLEELLSVETKQKVAASEKGYLGVYGKDVNVSSSQAYSIPDGVYIYKIVSGGGSEQAGLSERYVITKIDNQSVTGMDDLEDILEYYKIGEQITVTYQTLKNNQYVEKEVVVTLTGQS
jgi:serine protease Do